MEQLDALIYILISGKNDISANVKLSYLTLLKIILNGCVFGLITRSLCRQLSKSTMQTQFISRGIVVSLFRLNRTGLLAKETTVVLTRYAKYRKWTNAGTELFRLGFVSSKQRAQEIVTEIKNRVMLYDPQLPNFEDLVIIASSNIDLQSISEIYFVYLYYSNSLFSKLVDAIMEVYDKNRDHPFISRDQLIQIFSGYISHSKRKVGQKTVRNWIGKFTSVMKDTHILVPKKGKEYFLNFGAISPMTWTFFILHAYFHKYPPSSAKFISAFHILPEHIPPFMEISTNRNWLIFSNVEQKDNYIKFNVESRYHSFEEWISDLK